MAIDIAVNEGIAELVINSPPVNALDSAGWFEFADAVKDQGNRDDIRCLVIRAEGRLRRCALRLFCRVTVAGLASMVGLGGRRDLSTLEHGELMIHSPDLALGVPAAVRHSQEALEVRDSPLPVALHADERAAVEDVGVGRPRDARGHGDEAIGVRDFVHPVARYRGIHRHARLGGEPLKERVHVRDTGVVLREVVRDDPG